MKIKILDEHVEAFIFWEEQRKKKRISKSDTLLHVDSHHDMLYPKILDESLYEVKDIQRFVEENLNIANFIIPAAIRGCFSEILFLTSWPYPDLNRKQKDHIPAIYKLKQTRIKKHEFRSWQDEGKIWYQDLNKIGLEMINSKKKHVIGYKELYTLSKVSSGKEVILDIDMDYFALNRYQDFQYKPKLTPAQISQAKIFSTSNDEYKINLNFVVVDKNGCVALADPRLYTMRDRKSYNADPIWIDFAIREFSHGLKRIKPKVISICRSVKSGFTPKEYSSQIEESLKEYLCAKTPVNTTPPYKLNFEIHPEIIYDSDKKMVLNLLNLEETFLKKPEDIIVWEMIQQKAMFGDIITYLVKNFNWRKRKAEKCLVEKIWRLKRERVIR